MTGKRFLILAACANFAIALLHAVIPFMGVNGYIYFGTSELALLESQGSPVPEIATWFLALVFAGFGFYCLSGAGTIRRLPLLTPALWFIGGIYTLRGLILILDIAFPEWSDLSHAPAIFLGGRAGHRVDGAGGNKLEKVTLPCQTRVMI